MGIIKQEADRCINNGFSLEFKVPTDEELKQINLIHRDRTELEIKNMKTASKLARELTDLITGGQVEVNDVPELAKLLNGINRFGEMRGDEVNE